MVRKRVLGPEAIKGKHSGETEAEGDAVRRKLSPRNPKLLGELTWRSSPLSFLWEVMSAQSVRVGTRCSAYLPPTLRPGAQ